MMPARLTVAGEACSVVDYSADTGLLRVHFLAHRQLLHCLLRRANMWCDAGARAVLRRDSQGDAIVGEGGIALAASAFFFGR